MVSCRVTGGEHVPELVRSGRARIERIWRCRRCHEPLYEIPAKDAARVRLTDAIERSRA
jgi:hypothetical protein